MQSFIKLLFGGYGSGNWEYLAQHGGTQFLKRKSAQRPFWLPLLYIAMMGIGFWYRGMGLPWFMKYLVQAAVVGLAACFLLITGDFNRLPLIGEYYIIFLIPFVMMAAWSMLVWSLDFQQLNYMSRGCSTILYHMISLTSMCAAVYLFGGKAIDYTFYGMCIANVCILVFDSLRPYGLSEFITGFIAFAKSGGVDTNAPIKALEVHDLTFGFGLMVLYYALFEKGWRRVVHLTLAAGFFYLGLKRIALIGMLGVLVMHLFITRLKPKGRTLCSIPSPSSPSPPACSTSSSSGRVCSAGQWTPWASTPWAARACTKPSPTCIPSAPRSAATASAGSRGISAS